MANPFLAISHSRAPWHRWCVARSQDFISACLTYQQRLRPDVLELAEMPYLRRK